MKTEEQIRVLALGILNACAADEPALPRVHTALCEALSQQQASTGVGVMSLLWTALNELKQTHERSSA